MSTRGSLTKKPNWIDSYVGSRMRLRRKMLNMSQEQLGEKLGITFQQVQKYEKGTNRVGASRLYSLAGLLQVPVAFFFPQPEASGAASGMREEGSGDFVMDSLASAEGVELNRLFAKTRDPKVRRKIIELVRAIAETSER